MVTSMPLFEDAFWNLLCREENALEVIDSTFDKTKTYLFELCCEANRVVTRYKRDTLFLIGARDKASGTILPKEHLDELAAKVSSSSPILILLIFSLLMGFFLLSWAKARHVRIITPTRAWVLPPSKELLTGWKMKPRHQIFMERYVYPFLMPFPSILIFSMTDTRRICGILERGTCSKDEEQIL